MGRIESMLTLACAANATACINYMILRGLVPDERAIEAAVQTGNTGLIRKIDSAAHDATSRFRAFRWALLTESQGAAAFFERKSTAFTECSTAMLSLPKDDFSTACAVANHVALLMDARVMVFQEKLQDKQDITDAVMRRVLAGRSPELCEQIFVFAGWTGWKDCTKNGLSVNDGATRWAELRLIDFSGSLVSIIGEMSFLGCHKLMIVRFADSLLSVELWALGGCSSIVELAFPDGAEKIGVAAFCLCTSLKSARFGSGLKVLGAGAFRQCGSLVDLILPDQNVKIEKDAFSKCSSLKAVKFGNQLVFLGSGAFEGCSSLVELGLPDRLEEIGMWAFLNCTSLKNAKFGSGLKRLDCCAFEGCSSLTELVLPDGLREVGARAFHSCHSLKRVRFGGGLKRLGCSAFEDCSSLADLVVPDGVEEVPDHAFFAVADDDDK
jgi:hypothetical protein